MHFPALGCVDGPICEVEGKMQVMVTDVSIQVSSSLAVLWLRKGIDVLCIAAELGLNLNWNMNC